MGTPFGEMMSMHNSNLVVCIKHGGKILRENNDVVTLPFGAEFSIYVKNLNSVRSQVSISVDGKDIADGQRLIVEPNSSMEIERFIRQGNMQSGNRLKFVERTAAVEEHRGIGSDDGLVRVEGWREHIRPFVPVPQYYYQPIPVPRPYPVWPRYPHRPTWDWYSDKTICSNLSKSEGATGSVGSSGEELRGGGSMLRHAPRSFGGGVRMMSMFSATEASMVQSDAGITVPGSESAQQFRQVAGFYLEPNSVVVVLRLRGEVGGVAVAAPVTVAHKPSCTTCGKSNKAGSKFCAICGTALVLV